jgi:hypothetical protein
MTDDGPDHDDKPGKTLQAFYRTSLWILLVIVGVWIMALLSLERHRIVYDQLGMTEPGWVIEALIILGPAFWVISAMAPIVAVLLLIYGGHVLKHGSRRTMKRMLVANTTLVVIVIGIWCLPYFVL